MFIFEIILKNLCAKPAAFYSKKSSHFFNLYSDFKQKWVGVLF